MTNLVLLIIVAILLLIIILLVGSKSFKRLVEEAVVKTENDLKGKSGTEKLQYALTQLKKVSWIARLFSEKKLTKIINALVSEFNKFYSK